MGIEPTWPAWKAGALPLSYTRLELQSKVILASIGLLARPGCGPVPLAPPFDPSGDPEALVEGVGFEPTKTYVGRFTVCCL
jgi:hypothetical protein